MLLLGCFGWLLGCSAQLLVFWRVARVFLLVCYGVLGQGSSTFFVDRGGGLHWRCNIYNLFFFGHRYMPASPNLNKHSSWTIID